MGISSLFAKADVKSLNNWWINDFVTNILLSNFSLLLALNIIVDLKNSTQKSSIFDNIGNKNSLIAAIPSLADCNNTKRFACKFLWPNANCFIRK